MNRFLISGLYSETVWGLKRLNRLTVRRQMETKYPSIGSNSRSPERSVLFINASEYQLNVLAKYSQKYCHTSITASDVSLNGIRHETRLAAEEWRPLSEWAPEWALDCHFGRKPESTQTYVEQWKRWKHRGFKVKN